MDPIRVLLRIVSSGIKHFRHFKKGRFQTRILKVPYTFLKPNNVQVKTIGPYAGSVFAVRGIKSLAFYPSSLTERTFPPISNDPWSLSPMICHPERPSRARAIDQASLVHYLAIFYFFHKVYRKYINLYDLVI